MRPASFLKDRFGWPWTGDWVGMDLLPAACGRPKWIGKRDVVAPRIQPLLRLRIAFHDSVERLTVPFDKSSEIGIQHRSHLPKLPFLARRNQFDANAGGPCLSWVKDVCCLIFAACPICPR